MVQEMWRSKLGTNYPKDFMEKNEARLKKELQAVRDLPENRVCADCGARGTPWASVNLGVFLCMTCGSHHRSLGTHISLPKGCTGTYLWGPDEIDRMQAMGNARARELYGNVPPSGLTNEDAIRWKDYLTDKYVHKKYASTNGAGSAKPSTFASVAPPSPASPLPRASLKIAKTTKFTKQPIPDMDLIHFDDEPYPNHSPSSHHQASSSFSANSPKSASTSRQSVPAPSAKNGNNFFADFGL
jgi:Putative GTPase activating protein for Arf